MAVYLGQNEVILRNGIGGTLNCEFVRLNVSVPSTTPLVETLDSTITYLLNVWYDSSYYYIANIVNNTFTNVQDFIGGVYPHTFTINGNTLTINNGSSTAPKVILVKSFLTN